MENFKWTFLDNSQISQNFSKLPNQNNSINLKKTERQTT
ncbi:hypothetical protein A33Q_4286 [Indibacter alkaliphilus LW1]|uniref:Uncharacterized protein n=1 Tax=Indibacter alkaliphilus (strain CCUG 57479 / KCTC 22604 / LW1) TaxID=1189612 RepID=S2DQP2_INDAL|nr:hypothetical protein A33Q_4286 [Indibacter alkaliphilus LW1]